MIVIVKFIGILQTMANAMQYNIELEEKATVSTLIAKLKAEFFSDIDEVNLLIMKDGKEISVFRGLQTELKNSFSFGKS